VQSSPTIRVRMRRQPSRTTNIVSATPASAPACPRDRLRPLRRRTIGRASRLRNKRLRFTRKPCRRTGDGNFHDLGSASVRATCGRPPVFVRIPSNAQSSQENGGAVGGNGANAAVRTSESLPANARVYKHGRRVVSIWFAANYRMNGRGRSGCCQPPPARIPACASNAPGSSLGFWRRSGDRAEDVVSGLTGRSGQ
jgi:hypothetical protein